MKQYRVWTRYQRPEDGCVRAAESSFEARKAVSRIRGIAVVNVMARPEEEECPCGVCREAGA